MDVIADIIEEYMDGMHPAYVYAKGIPACLQAGIVPTQNPMISTHLHARCMCAFSVAGRQELACTLHTVLQALGTIGETEL